MKTILSILFLFAGALSGSAQITKIDSLKQILSAPANDTNSIKTFLSIARAFQSSGHIDSALKYANNALEVSTNRNFSKEKATAFITLADIFAENNNYDTAFKLIDSCINIRQQLQDQAGLGEAHILYAQLYRYIDNYPQSINHLVNAEKIYDALNDTTAIIYLYSIYGTVYIDYGHSDEAINYLLKAANAYSKNGKARQLSDVLSTISVAYLEQGNLSEALTSINKAIAIDKNNGTETNLRNSLYLAKIYTQIGEQFESEKKHSMAKENFELALKEIKPTLEKFESQNNYLGKVNSYITIGRIYLGLNKYAEADNFLHKCLALARQTNNLFETRDSYLYLSKLNSKKNKPADAFDLYKKYISFRDSIVNQNNTRQIAQMQLQYGFDKEEAMTKSAQERKDAIVKKEREKQIFVRNSFIAGFGIMMVFAGIFFLQRNKINKEKKRSDALLLNILPGEVAEELKTKGSTEAKQFKEVTVMFTDFKGFTQISEKLSPAELVAEIDSFFKAFDSIIGHNNIEKIKTIGDSYMCAGGLPVANSTHAMDVIKAALEIQAFVDKNIEERTKEGKPSFEIRIGIHTGPVVAGIVGSKKFAYDIWGDTVNIASRMESSGEAGKINISETTYQLAKETFKCTFRGKIKAKNKGEIDMYFVERTI